jgi:hypothetical protein
VTGRRTAALNESSGGEGDAEQQRHQHRVLRQRAEFHVREVHRRGHELVRNQDHGGRTSDALQPGTRMASNATAQAISLQPTRRPSHSGIQTVHAPYAREVRKRRTPCSSDEQEKRRQQNRDYRDEARSQFMVHPRAG